MNKTITIFGSSMPREGSKEYDEAYRLSSLLAVKGFNICSGGYGGIMDAVSKGAFDKGAEAVGITLKNSASIQSKYLTKEIKCDTLFERLTRLIEYGDGYAVLGGGTGTLLELAAIWELMNKKIIPAKPAACFSPMWRQVIEVMEKQIKSEGRETGLIKVFHNVDDAAGYFTGLFSI